MGGVKGRGRGVDGREREEGVREKEKSGRVRNERDTRVLYELVEE